MWPEENELRITLSSVWHGAVGSVERCVLFVTGVRTFWMITVDICCMTLWLVAWFFSQREMDSNVWTAYCHWMCVCVLGSELKTKGMAGIFGEEGKRGTERTDKAHKYGKMLLLESEPRPHAEGGFPINTFWVSACSTPHNSSSNVETFGPAKASLWLRVPR